jgi:hypothetical protein
MRDFQQIAQSLAVALKALQMYTVAHPRAKESLAASYSMVERWLEEQKRLQFVVSASRTFLDGQVLETKSPQVAALAKLVSERGVGGFIFDRGVTAEEYLAFLQGLATKPPKLEEQGGFETFLSSRGVLHIKVSQVKYQEIREGEEAGSGDQAPVLNPAPLAKGGTAGRELAQMMREALLASMARGMGAHETPTGLGQGLGLGLGQGQGQGLGQGQGPGQGLGQGQGPDQGLGQGQGPGQGLGQGQGQGLGQGQGQGQGLGQELPWVSRGLGPAELGSLGALGRELGLGEDQPSPTQLALLRQALMEWTPSSQLGLLASSSNLPKEFPAGLRHGIHSLAGELLTMAVGTAPTQGAAWKQLQGPLLEALRSLKDRDAIAGNLLANLQALGQDTAEAEAALAGLEASSGGGTEQEEPGLLADLGPADLGMLAPLEQALGIQKGGPTSEQLAALRTALLGLPPEVQLSLMAGLAQLPDPPEGLALGLKALSAEVLAAATVTALAGGAAWPQLRGPIQGILNLLTDRKSLVRAFASHLRTRGMDPAQAEPILRDLAWDDLSLEARLLKILEHGFLFELSLEQRLALLRELLDLRRYDEFLRIQDILLEALRSEWPDFRLKAAKTLGGMTRWARQPGLPPEGIDPLTKGLREHFGSEPEPSIHQWTAEALDTLLSARVLRGDLLGALSDLQELEALLGFTGSQHPWQVDGITRLHAALSRRELLDAAVDHFLHQDRLQLSQEAPPYLAATGDSLLQHLLERLAGEQDRTTRGRLVEVIRTIGPTALPSLMSALGSSAWYLVRNALTLLADLGNASCLPSITPLLSHSEPRVRRHAIRALWKLGGPAAEPHLLGRMKETDAEAMEELLFAFGQLRSERSVAPISELAQDKRVLERIRIQALETLASIPSPRAMPALLECIRRKGFFSPGEPPAIRMAAAKALAALRTPEARAALQKLADTEPRGEERELLRRLLKGPVPP